MLFKQYVQHLGEIILTTCWVSMKMSSAWRPWSSLQTSPVTTRAVTLTTFLFLCMICKGPGIHNNIWLVLPTLRHDEAYICYPTGPILTRAMAYGRFSAKPLPQLICQFFTRKTTWTSQNTMISFTKMQLKMSTNYWPFCSGRKTLHEESSSQRCYG